jgi:phytoene synthase
MTTAVVRDAYRECERTTRREARNFFYGIALLPPDKRRAMSAVYAFARRIDDIGDEEGPADEKLEQLRAERAAVAELREGRPSLQDGTLVALGDARARFDLPLDALEQLIDGVVLDVTGATYETFDELRHYCACVAGTIGRLCVAIFGSADPAAALRHADELGVAMQLTNIVRDVLEDLENGRVYLPAEDLRRFGCTTPVDGDPADVERLVRFEAARAREWFDRGLRLLPLLDRRSASCVLAMTGIYRRILQRIEADPSAVSRGRIALPTHEKVLLAARSMAGLSQ